MIFQTQFPGAQTGVGYQFYSTTALLGSKVTSGITTPSTGLYIATATPPDTAVGIEWTCDNAAFVLREELESAADLLTAEVETGLTVGELFQGLAAVNLNKSAVTETTVTYRDFADTKNRIVALVDDSGQRTSITFTFD